MSEQNPEQTDGGLPVQDIEGVHADPTDLPEQVQPAGDMSGAPAFEERAVSPDQAAHR